MHIVWIARAIVIKDCRSNAWTVCTKTQNTENLKHQAIRLVCGYWLWLQIRVRLIFACVLGCSDVPGLEHASLNASFSLEGNSVHSTMDQQRIHFPTHWHRSLTDTIVQAPQSLAAGSQASPGLYRSNQPQQWLSKWKQLQSEFKMLDQLAYLHLLVLIISHVLKCVH